MRLSEEEISNFKTSLLNIDKNAKIYLFGSRVDDSKRGGDIDLLIISKSMIKKDLRLVRVNFFSEFDEQKIDIVLDDGLFSDPFIKLIFKDAIEL
ncbi:MAG: nucleotidyltransferase domain-containing protein [Spirochaetaceae bacterium]